MAHADPFWDALADGKFLVGACADCEGVHFPPVPVCPHCGGDGEFAQARGEGTLHSFSRQHRTAPGFDAPLTVGLVDLAAGPRVLMRVDAEYDDLAIGHAVDVVAREYEGGLDRGRRADAPLFVAVPR